MSPADRDTIAVSTAEAQRNLGLTAHYAGLTADALAVGNVEIALTAFRSLILHARLASVDVRAIEGLATGAVHAEAAE